MANTFNLPSLFHPQQADCIGIAHRGASAYFPENTMVAFEAAREMGAGMIELDVMLTQDGIPAIFHDAELDIHTNGTGFFNDYTLNELKKLDAGSSFSAEFAGETIPSLEEVLAFASGEIALNIEIKTEAVTDKVSGGIEEKCLKLVSKYNLENHVLFSSFDYRAAAHLKELNENIPVALLYDRSQFGRKLPHEVIHQYGADAFNCSYNQLTRKRLKDVRKHQIPTFVYTVNSERKMKKLLEIGVNGIFTDRPDVLNRVIQQVSDGTLPDKTG